MNKGNKGKSILVVEDFSDRIGVDANVAADTFVFDVEQDHNVSGHRY